MKKRSLSVLLALILCLSLLSMSALAAETVLLEDVLDAAGFTPGTTEMTAGDAAAILTAAGYDAGTYAQTPDRLLTRAEACQVIATLFQLPVPEGTAAIDYFYQQGYIQGVNTGDASIVDLDPNGQIVGLAFQMLASRFGNSIPVPDSEGEDGQPEGEDGQPEGEDGENGEDGESAFDGLASNWAKPELERADALGLIPDILAGKDLREDITRGEFAAVVVKLYEDLAGTAAIPAINNPFTDCKDVDVLKAYNIGAVNGTSPTTYDPDALLNREQMATMLTRVFKKVSLAGWTLETDSQFTLPYTMPAPFADDANISDYARDSVYFMAANQIINGVGDNCFAPKNTTDKEAAEGYANATREQALLIALRMVENLGQ